MLLDNTDWKMVPLFSNKLQTVGFAKWEAVLPVEFVMEFLSNGLLVNPLNICT